MNRLCLFRTFHTLVFFFMSACLVYVLYSGITATFNLILLIALSAIFAEGLVLILNRWQCPLTILAEKLGADKGSVTDLFLPTGVARHSFRVSTVLFIVGLVLLSIQYLNR